MRQLPRSSGNVGMARMSVSDREGEKLRLVQLGWHNLKGREGVGGRKHISKGGAGRVLTRRGQPLSPCQLFSRPTSLRKEGGVGISA